MANQFSRESESTSLLPAYRTFNIWNTCLTINAQIRKLSSFKSIQIIDSCEVDSKAICNFLYKKAHNNMNFYNKERMTDT